jgi:lysophospholipase L1-like esterase
MHLTKYSLAILSFLAAAGCGESGSLTSASPAGAASSAVTATAPLSADLPSARSAATGDFPFKTILCFGDSITYGITLQAPGPDAGEGVLSLTEGYVPKLWRLLEAEHGTGIMLVNDGIGGETTDDGLARFQEEVQTYRPDLVLLLEGVVDVNNDAPRFPVVRANLAEMMHIAHREGTHVIIGTYPLLSPDGFRNSGAENVPRLNDIIRQEAAKQGVPVADHEKAFTDTTGQGPDGLHPNNLGYEVIAQVWFDAIEAFAAAISGMGT